MVIFWVLRFSSKSSIVTSKMCWFQIWPQKLSTGTRSKAISNLILEIWKAKAGLRGAKRKKIMIVWKDLSLGRKLGIFFKKTNYQLVRQLEGHYGRTDGQSRTNSFFNTRCKNRWQWHFGVFVAEILILWNIELILQNYIVVVII